MGLDEYLKLGKHYYSAGHNTDGCTLVGWFVHRIWPELEEACHCHDYARRGLIVTKSQYENDKLFRSALKKLGAPLPLRTLMYIAVRIQGLTGMPPGLLACLLFIFSFVATIMYLDG